MEEWNAEILEEFVQKFTDEYVGLDAAGYSVSPDLRIIIIHRRKLKNRPDQKGDKVENWGQESKKYMRREWGETGTYLVVDLEKTFGLVYEVNLASPTFVELRRIS